MKDEIEIPREIMEKHYKIELCVDIMYVNGMAFLSSIDRTIRYRAVIYIPKRKKVELYNAIDKVLRLYNGAGFNIETIYIDGEFKEIMDEVKDEMNIDMNYTNAQDHVPEAERNNRTIKERVRSQYHRLPYKNIPKVMIKKLVMESARKLFFFSQGRCINILQSNDNNAPIQVRLQQTLHNTIWSICASIT